MAGYCGIFPASSTGNFPDDQAGASRDISHMSQDLLLTRITERLATMKLSARKASMNAKLGPDYIRDLFRKPTSPSVDNLVALAQALGVPASYFIEAVQPEQDGLKPARLASVHVRGAIQAGVWKDAIEWPPDDWFAVTVPMDDRFPGAPVYGLLVRGKSMDLIFPDGTVVLVTPFFEVGRLPKPGEKVVVLRRSATGEYEATLKQYDTDDQGRHVLWPRSSDPDFQTPIILEGAEPPVALVGDGLPTATSAGALTHAAGAGDIIIAGLVIGSYRRE
jgi:SOS-response transcriptional repressor LexA